MITVCGLICCVLPTGAPLVCHCQVLSAPSCEGQNYVHAHVERFATLFALSCTSVNMCPHFPMSTPQLNVLPDKLH